jgi:two-component system sensor histidine kinase DctS
VGEVASTLAHELNQPLGALSSFANGLLNRLRDGTISLPELLPVVERMARLAERAGGIIRRVNDFARRRELSRQRLDLVALLTRILASWTDTAAVAPRWQPPTQPIWIEADELLLEHSGRQLAGQRAGLGDPRHSGTAGVAGPAPGPAGRSGAAVGG